MKVTLQNLTKKFPQFGKNNGNGVVAVNDFSMEFPDGKLVALLGPSGCGKSTVLNMICGLLKPSEGKVFFGDDDVTNLPAEERGVGMVFQNYALYPHLTVEQNIRFPLENLKGKNKLSKEELHNRVNDAKKLVQIEELSSRKPGELSGGQQQRVAIARALVKMPKILLLDEPFSNLDARLRLQTREELRRIQKLTGITTIFVTHDQEEAMSISDNLVVMRGGILMQEGLPQQVYDNPSNLFVSKFLGTPTINVFEGKIKDNSVYIGEEIICTADNLPDKEVYVCIRPEGFIVNENGAFSCKLARKEVMGRDVTIVCSNKFCLSENIRAIIDSDTEVNENAEYVNFNIKANKLFLFDKQTEKRIYF